MVSAALGLRVAARRVACQFVAQRQMRFESTRSRTDSTEKKSRTKRDEEVLLVGQKPFAGTNLSAYDSHQLTMAAQHFGPPPNEKQENANGQTISSKNKEGNEGGNPLSNLSPNQMDSLFDIMENDPDFDLPEDPMNEFMASRQKMKSGFMNLGVKRGGAEEGENEEDPDFECDDITSTAHGDMELHREFRHYARIAAWEMPLLTQLAKEFKPPTSSEFLRYRFTSYMGEQHPAEKKVVVEFCPDDVPNLAPIQLLKLKKLVGVRYNPQTNIIKMGCEMFETPAANKAYLNGLVGKIVTEARDSTDDFADVPLDLRHHKWKKTPKFPTQWKLTPERKLELAQMRKEVVQSEEQRQVRGLLVDGVEEIQEAFKKAQALPEPVPEVVMAGKGKPKGGKRLAIRR